MDKFHPQQPGNNGKNTPSQRGAGALGSSASGQDVDLKSKLKESANSLQQELKQQANLPRQAEQVAERARQTLTQRVERIATVLDDVGARLDQEEEPWLGDGAHGLATRIRRACRHIEERRVDELMGEVRGFSSASPIAFLGGAFVVGLAAGRFLKGARNVSEGRGTSRGSQAEVNPMNGKTPSQRGLLVE